MGSGCSKPQPTNTIASVNHSIPHLVPVSNNAANQKTYTKLPPLIVKQIVSNVTNHSNQNNQPMIHQESTEKSVPTSSENSKPSSSNKSTKHEDYAVAFDAANSTTHPSKHKFTHKTTNESHHQKTESRSSDNHQKQNDHHCQRSHEKSTSSPDTLIPVKHNNTTHRTADEPVDHSKNASKTRIPVGVSHKHPPTENNQQHQNDPHHENLNERMAANSNKSKIEESVHDKVETTHRPFEKHSDYSMKEPTVPESSKKHAITENGGHRENHHHKKQLDEKTTSTPDTAHRPVEKHTDDSRKEPTLPENSHSKRTNSGDSNKHLVTENNQQRHNDHHHRRKVHEETASTSDHPIEVENNHTAHRTNHGPIEKHSTGEPTNSENSHSKRVNSGDSNKHPLVEDNHQRHDDHHHRRKLHEKTASTSDHSTEAENNHTTHHTNHGPIGKNSTGEPTSSENSHSKRINSGDSNKHPLTENHHKRHDDHHRRKLHEETVSTSDHLMEVENNHTAHQTNNGPIEKPSTEEPTSSENSHSKRVNSGDSNKHPLTENNHQRHDDHHHRRKLYEKTASTSDHSTEVENNHTAHHTNHGPIEKHSTGEPTSSENSHSKRIHSGDLNQHRVTENNHPEHNDHHNNASHENPTSFSGKPKTVESTHAKSDSSHEPAKKHIDGSTNQPTHLDNTHSKRIYLGDSHQHSVTENDQHHRDDHHNKNASFSDKPMKTEHDHTNDDHPRRKTNDSREEPTDSDNTHSKRISSGDSNKHSVTENNHRSRKLTERRASTFDKPTIIENSDATSRPMEKHIDHSSREPTSPESFHSKRINSGDSNKYPSIKNSHQKNDETGPQHERPTMVEDTHTTESWHSKRMNPGVSNKHPATEKDEHKEADASSDDSMFGESVHNPVKKHTNHFIKEPTIFGNLHRKRTDSGDSTEHQVTEGNQHHQSDHHNKRQHETRASFSEQPTIPDTAHDLITKNIDDSPKRAKSPEHPHSKRVNSGDSNKHPLIENNHQRHDDHHHRRKLHEETASTSDHPMEVENKHTTHQTNHGPIEKPSTGESTSSRNSHSKRVNSGDSNKHPLIENNHQRHDDHHHRRKVHEETDSTTDHPMEVENNHTTHHTNHGPIEKPSTGESTSSENSHSKRINSGDSNKHPLIENNHQRHDDHHHRRKLHEKKASTSDHSAEVENNHTTHHTNHGPIEKHSIGEPTSSRNSHSKRVNSGDSNKHPVIENNHQRHDDHHHRRKVHEETDSTTDHPMEVENNHTTHHTNHGPIEKPSTGESTSSENSHSKRIHSGDSNKHPLTENNHQRHDDHHRRKLDEETASTFDHPIEVENNHTAHQTNHGPIEKPSTGESTNSENSDSKRIHSGDSNKHPITENHSEKLSERIVIIPEKSTIVENIHTIPDTIHRPFEKHTDHSTKEPTQANAGVSNKDPIVENSHHSKTFNDKRPSIPDNSTVVENIHPLPSALHGLVERRNDHSKKQPTTPENSQSRRINSGDAKNHQNKENDHHITRLIDKLPFIPDKSPSEENTHTIPDTTHRPVERHTDHSTKDSNSPENSHSKRIHSGDVNKHPSTENQQQHRNEHHGKSSITHTKPITIEDLHNKPNATHHNNHPNDSIGNDSSLVRNESMMRGRSGTISTVGYHHAEIIDADPKAFNTTFIQQRDDAINNRSYRSAIESWKPSSLQQLIQAIQSLSKGRSLIDCYWIIFYWIAHNIDYDVASFLDHDIPSQSVEDVFRTRKGVSAGYSRLYKYLCDQLDIKCVEITGYAKGYAFEKRKYGVRLQKDHAWNAVRITDHWYFIDPTWGTGYLTEQNTFQRELDCFYFLARPQQMIYHHLPEDDDWQLLRTPISKTQYEQMAKLRPPYFNLNLELISPPHPEHLSLVRDKPFALILVRAPADVDLLGSLKLNEKKVKGGHRIVFDRKKRVYRCYFAPASTGEHQVCLFAKNVKSPTNAYELALDFTLNIDHLPQNPISYPTIWKKFYDLDLKVLSPVHTHLIKVGHRVNQAQVVIQVPDDVELIGNLIDHDRKKIEGGEQVYYDRDKSVWRCNFAPNRDGLFEANIFAKKRSTKDNYSSVISFKIEASQMPSPPISHPQTWQLFYDLDLKIESPQNCSTVPWPAHAAYVEVLIRAPNDVQLFGKITHNNADVHNGSLTQFDHERKLWQLLFAPQSVGEHDLVVFAKRNHDEESVESAVVKFYLHVTQLNRSMKFPTIHKKFHAHKCQLYEPLHGVLKKGTSVPIHCVIPGASDVKLTVDSNFVKANGYHDSTLKQTITVGSKEVTIYANYGQKSNYDGLVQYTVV